MGMRDPQPAETFRLNFDQNGFFSSGWQGLINKRQNDAKKNNLHLPRIESYSLSKRRGFCLFPIIMDRSETESFQGLFIVIFYDFIVKNYDFGCFLNCPGVRPVIFLKS